MALYLDFVGGELVENDAGPVDDIRVDVSGGVAEARDERQKQTLRLNETRQQRTTAKTDGLRRGFEQNHQNLKAQFLQNRLS